jgi:hypothetical protein
MSLPPFLKHKKIAGLIVEQRKVKDDKPEQESNDSEGLHACAQEIIQAIEMKDHRALASALQAAFQLMEMAPHEEGPHTYEAQNRKAGMEE